MKNYFGWGMAWVDSGYFWSTTEMKGKNLVHILVYPVHKSTMQVPVPNTDTICFLRYPCFLGLKPAESMHLNFPLYKDYKTPYQKKKVRIIRSTSNTILVTSTLLPVQNGECKPSQPLQLQASHTHNNHKQVQESCLLNRKLLTKDKT